MINKVGSSLQILNKDYSLYKTASNDNKVITQKSDAFTYFATYAVHADVPNMNADIFPLDELKKSYKSFIGRGLYLDHNASSVANAVGKVFDAKLVEVPGATEEEGKYAVMCLCGVDKTAHPDIATKVAHGILDSVSMGANVTTAVCNICGCVAHTPEEFCVHLQHQGQIDPETGKRCCSINRGVNFTELSIVGVAADPYAKMQQVFADFVGGLKKQAEIPEKKWAEKFSFNIPCGNEKICEMLYNLLSSYNKQGIMDLSKDGAILKLNVEAGSKEEALQKLEYISKEQGLDVEKPLKKEEKSMSEEIKPVEEQVEKEAGIVPTEDVTLDDGTTYTVRYNPNEQSILSVMQDGKEVGIDGGTRLQILRKLFHKDEPTIVEEKTAELDTKAGEDYDPNSSEKQSNIEKKADFDEEDSEPLYTKLEMAIAGTNLDEVKKLLNTGKYDVNRENSLGETPLYLAQTKLISNLGDKDTNRSIIKLLLAHGAKLGSKKLEEVDSTVRNTPHLTEEEKEEAERPFTSEEVLEEFADDKGLNKNESTKMNLNKTAVDTKLKEYQRQTKDFQGEPVEAPANVVDALNQIKELRTEISEKEIELAKITQELGIEDLNDELQNVLNGAADSLKNLQGQVLRYGKQLITYQEEVKTQDFKPTVTWIKEKLAKYPEALAYIEKAIDGAQNMAKKTETSTIKVYDPNNK